MSELHQQLQDYLAIRRAMGFKMERHAKLLGQFTDHLAAHDAVVSTTLTIEHALAWAGAPSAADPRWWAARLSMVRGFAVYLHALDPAHQVPPHGLLPSGSRRTMVPYLYTDPEIAALVHAAGELSGPGTAMSRDALERRLAKHAATAASVEPTITEKKVSPHVLRHTAAMRLLEDGVDSTVIALWLGHESVATTQIYVHADLALKEQALARTAPLDATPGRYRPSDTVMAFLDGL